jgi:phospholipid/cholesterol/gamma-HCH transport system substrate-binding protein
MRPNRALEIGTGLFVLLGFAALLFLSTQLPGSGIRVGKPDGFLVTARFDNVGDLKVGSPVSMAGVNIGRVESVGFDSNDFRAVVQLRIQSQFSSIPEDSDASIQTAGLLGGKYVGIGPGGSDVYLQEGSQIEFTQSAIVLENLINKFFAGFAGRGSESSNDGASDASP